VLAAAIITFPGACGDRAAALAFADEAGRRSADLVATTDWCLVRIGRLQLPPDDSIEVARRVFDAFQHRVATHDRLGFRQVWKRPHVVVTATPTSGRVLLPHHDGGSVTRLETPDATRLLDRVERKAYAAFVVVDTGTGPSTTTFYPIVPMVRRAMVPTGVDAAPNLSDAYRWFDGNRRRFAETKRRYGIEGRYLTLPRALGAHTPALIVLDRNEGHDDLTADEVALFPHLATMRAGCPCGTCRGEVTRVYCHGLNEAMGLSWPQVRAEYESPVSAERWDLVLWNNVFLQHGAVGGGTNRTLMHAYLVWQGPGREYAAWTAGLWAQHWNRLPAVAVSRESPRR
jgi:hypothetical protein